MWAKDEVRTTTTVPAKREGNPGKQLFSTVSGLNNVRIIAIKVGEEAVISIEAQETTAGKANMHAKRRAIRRT